MKKFLLSVLAIFLMGSTLTMNAQNEQQTKAKKQRPSTEQIQQRQCEQMVRVLMLDDATADKFKPVYSQYLKDLMDCRSMRHGKKGQNIDNNAVKTTPTDAEIEANIKDQFAQSRKMLDIRESYYGKFRKLLSPKQIQKIYQTEKNNANKFRNEWDKRKGMGPGGRMGMGPGGRMGMRAGRMGKPGMGMRPNGGMPNANSVSNSNNKQ